MAVSFETLEYDVGGVRTVVKAVGRGRPVLFLHGAATLEGFDFAEGSPIASACSPPATPASAFPATRPISPAWRIWCCTI